MKLEQLQQCTLFQNFEDNEIEAILKETKAYQRQYQKNAYVYHMQDTQVDLGIVLRGKVAIIQRDYFGKENIYSYVTPTGVFAETYALLLNHPLMVDVVVEENAQILFMNLQIIQISNHIIVQKFMQNLLRLLAKKNLLLSRKIIHISSKRIRERLFSYLQDECVTQQSNTIVIPYRQQQLADYLCVDRSALASELSKCKREGLVMIKKNIWKVTL